MCVVLQVLVAFSIDTDALGLLSRCAKCNGEFEDRRAVRARRCNLECLIVHGFRAWTPYAGACRQLALVLLWVLDVYITCCI